MSKPPSYAEIARRSLEALPHEVTAERKRRGLSMRPAARQIGVTLSTLERIESGQNTSTRQLMKIFTWLEEPPDTT
jgi:transcriptional regulator with XRE-family HTH domain